MKKIILAIFTMVAAAFTFQSCMKPVDNSKTLAKIDSLTNLKATAYRDSLKMVCMNDIMALATARADSMMQVAAKKAGKKYTPKKSSQTATTPTNPKADKMSGATKTATEEKKDKMSQGSQQTATDKKKSKMNKGQDTIPH